MSRATEQRTVAYGGSISARSWLTLLIGVVLGVGFFGLAVRDVSWSSVKSSLAEMKVVWVSLAVAAVILVALVKAERWRWLFFPHHQSIGYVDALAIILLGQVVNILLPIRLGEVLRAGLLTRRSDLRVMAVVGTIVVEKLVDALVLGATALILGSALVSLTGHAGASILALLFTLAALVGLALVLSRRQAVAAWLDRVFGRWSRGRWLASKTNAFLHGFDILQRRRAWLALGAWTALVWILSVITIILTFAAFNLAVPAAAALLIILIINLGLVLPAAPGLIGLIQYTSVLVLTQYGVDPSIAFSYGLILHLVLVVPLIVLAMWGWFRLRGIRVDTRSQSEPIEDEARNYVA